MLRHDTCGFVVVKQHIALVKAQCSTVRGLITSTLPDVNSTVQSYNLMFSLGGALSVCVDKRKHFSVDSLV